MYLFSKFTYQIIFQTLIWLIGFSAIANATIRYVKPGGFGNGTSWATATDSLQGIINASNIGDTVWVAQGTYYPTHYVQADTSIVTLPVIGGISYSNRDKVFLLKNGITIGWICNK
jgi:hypothetical protein